MIKLMHTGLAALIAATSIAATATPAAAEGHWGHGGGYGGYNSGYGYGGGYGGGYGDGDHEWREHHDHDNAAPLIIGGILGLGLIAALASSHSNHAQTQTDSPYGYGDNAQTNYHPDVCTQQRQVWDPNQGQYITRSYRVAC